MSDLKHQRAFGTLVYSAKSQKPDFDPDSVQAHRSEFHRATYLQVFNDTLRIVRSSKAFDQPAPAAGNRKAISGFSAKSQRALRFKALNTSVPLVSQFCATYHEKWPTDGKELKAQLNQFLTLLRYHYPGISYLWILEFQTRKTPHFHIYMSQPATEEMRMKLGRIWNKIADPGNETHLWWHTDRVDHRNGRELSALIDWDMGNGAYLCKYLDKQQQKNVPEEFENVGRFWGSSRGLVVKPQQFMTEEQDAFLKQFELSTRNVIRAIGKWHEKRLASVQAFIKTEGNKPLKIKSRVRRGRQSANIFHGSAIYKHYMRAIVRERTKESIDKYLTQKWKGENNGIRRTTSESLRELRRLRQERRSPLQPSQTRKVCRPIPDVECLP